MVSFFFRTSLGAQKDIFSKPRRGEMIVEKRVIRSEPRRGEILADGNNTTPTGLWKSRINNLNRGSSVSKCMMNDIITIYLFDIQVFMFTKTEAPYI